jgi:hypothetical protein
MKKFYMMTGESSQSNDSFGALRVERGYTPLKSLAERIE